MSNIKFIAPWLKAKAEESERGASLVEYALLVALIAVVCITAVVALGGAAKENFEKVEEEIRVDDGAAVTP